MTERQRKDLRQQLDAAKRARIAREREGSRRVRSGGVRFNVPPLIEGRCDYCGTHLPEPRPCNRGKHRFCSKTHKANYARVGRPRRDWEKQVAEILAQAPLTDVAEAA